MFESLQQQLSAIPPLTSAIAASILVLLAGYGVYRGAFAILGRLAALTQTHLDDILLKRMRLPSYILVFLLAAHTFLALQDFGYAELRQGITIVELLLAAYIVIETIETVVVDYWLLERKKIELPTLVRHLILIAIYTVTVLSIIGSTTGINVLPLMATSTVITVVLGLALQDTLGNLFAGLSMHVDQPFRVGDWVQLDAIEGQVISTGWRSTHLRTFSQDVIAIPNSLIARSRLHNFSAPTKLTARNIEFLVSPDAAPEIVEQAATDAVHSVAAILKDPPTRVRLLEMAPLFQRYQIKFHLEDFGIHDDTESHVQKALWHHLRKHNIHVDLQHNAVSVSLRM